MKRLQLVLIRLFFKISSRIFPALAVPIAARMFVTPGRKKRLNQFNKEIINRATPFTIPYRDGIELAAYRWGEKTDPIILLVHGWTGSSASFTHFIDPLLARGFQIVAYDVLAHGASPGKTANLIQWTETVKAAMAQLQQVHCIVGHSLGGGAILVASSTGLKTSKIVLVAPLSNIIDPTEAFADYVAIPRNTNRKMLDYFDKKYKSRLKIYGNNWSELFESDFNVPTLILHDKNDKEVPWSNGKQIADQWPWSTFITTDGLGHRRILREPDIISQVLEFVAE